MKALRVILFSLYFFCFHSTIISQGISVNESGDSPDGSAILDANSIDKGVLIPRITFSQRQNISSPATGLMIYQKDNIPGFYFFNGANWRLFGSEAFCINDLYDGTIGGYSMFLGSGAGLNDNGSINYNMAIGLDALQDNVSGLHNLAIGYRALYHTTEDNNHAVGYRALYYNSTGNSNTASGFQALHNNQTGNQNTAHGHNSLFYSTLGYSNTVAGYNASFNNTTGNCNTVVGHYANGYNQEGSNNTMLGYQAGRGGTTLHNKSGNIFIGFKAGYYELGSNKLYIESSDSPSPLIYGEFNNDLVRINGSLDINDAYQLPTTDGNLDQVLKTNGSGVLSWSDDNGATVIDELTDCITDNYSVFIGAGAGADDDGSDNRNVALGINALNSMIDGERNTAIGYEAMNTGSSGNYNTAIGFEALKSNNSFFNTAVGAQALRDNSNSANNALGFQALFNNTIGESNVAIGSSALAGNDSGDRNVAVGCNAMLLNSTGEYNTAIGHMALYNNNANGNTVIGYRAGYECTSGFGNVMIGYQAGLDETGSYKLYIESSSSGSPLIWGDFSDNRIVINGNSSHNPNNRTFFSNGSAGGTTTWYTDSDIRKKKNIHTISSSLEKVLHLRGVNFEWIDTESHCNGPQMGFVAQEVISVVPEVVDKNGDSYTMQYAPLTALLVEAIKEQQEVIESLKREIEVLKNSDDRE